MSIKNICKNKNLTIGKKNKKQLIEYIIANI
jgi:hypothetical protein